MKYFKTDKNEVYAYDDDADIKFYKDGLISITEEEAKDLISPPLTLEQQIEISESLRIQLRKSADAEIDWLQDAVDAGISTEAETRLLADWKKYRVLLMRVDLSNPEWPEIPA
ncbi:TPA: tail fiber assembly protein [Escherichia coli]|nr:tail fiber assembly protein [Escherichia coli]